MERKNKTEIICVDECVANEEGELISNHDGEVYSVKQLLNMLKLARAIGYDKTTETFIFRSYGSVGRKTGSRKWMIVKSKCQNGGDV